MADLTAKFRLVDEMSDRMAGIAESGHSMIEQWELAGEVASEAFDGISNTVTGAATTIDGVATSISSLQEVSSEASTSADSLSDTLNNYGEAAEAAATQSDYWTEAVGNYNISALEAIYSTEELVEMGFKSAEALEEQERMFELCEQSATYLSKAIESSSEIQNELTSSMERANETISELASNENISAEAKEELEKAATAAAEAMQELNSAQSEATAAMKNYDAVISSGTTDLSELEAAAERAYHAADNLAEANGKASNATEELSKTAENAAEQADKAGEKGTNAVEGVAGALAAAGITAMVKEIADAAYELAEAFSEAESTVVKATGASGEALDGLTTSMMNAYAASKSGSLEDTAGAIGEINTRMALTGDELTDVTGKFLDFSDITGTDVVGSVQNVTKIMNKWNVEGSEVESVLDKLAYAGQISGVSVDTLSNNLIMGAASFQEMGLSLDNAISMLAQFELYGMTGTTAITAMRTAVKNFSDDGLNAETALQSVINEIANMETAADATALAVDTFGSRAGVDMANAIRSGAISVDSLTGSLEVAQGTVKNTAETAQTLEQKWAQATGNVSAAFTTALQPALDKVSSGFAGFVNTVGTFLNEHPAVTKAIMAIGIGLGVVVAGVAGVTFVTTVAIPALTAFGVALNTALGPIGWVALAITGVVAAGTALVAMFSDAEDETAGMTAATREQYYELQDLNSEYEEACSKYGETSEEALRLKYQVDDLSESFEANRQTLEEFTAEVDELVQSHDELVSSYEESMTAVNQSEQGTLALIQKLEDLATQNGRTAAQEEQMKAVEQQAEQERQAEQKQTYVDLLKEQAILEDEIAKAEENLRLSQESDSNADFLSDAWFYDKTGWLGTWATDTDEYTESLEKLNVAYEENKAKIQEIETEWENAAQAAEETEDASVAGAEAAATAYEGVRAEIEELCTAYDEAYQSAIESFEGQFGLFDEASTKSEEYLNATVENAQKAINSQLEYWESYSADVETLKSTSAADLGITQENYEALMSYAQDGSEQAAGLAHNIASAIKQGDEEAVATLANTVGKVESKQAEIAAATADWQTNFTEKMNQYVSEMEETVGKMDLSPEAAKAATSTINSYTNSIRAGKGGAVAAAQEVANAVTAALQSAKASVNVNVNSSGSVPGHATGTTNAESVFVAGEAGPELIVSKAAAYATGTTNSDDFYIAGEDGPELIVGKQGSTVFPTEETDRIINSLSDRDRGPINITADTGDGMGNNSESSAGEQVRRILLEIAGSGAIEVGGGASKESILEVLTDHIKPVLLNLLQQEIYEEGDLSYDF